MKKNSTSNNRKKPRVNSAQSKQNKSRSITKKEATQNKTTSSVKTLPQEPQTNSKKGNSLLETFLTEVEITELEQNYPIFKRENYENCYAYKYELIMDTLKQAEEIIKQKQELNSFIKLLDWTFSQIKTNLDIKPDVDQFKNLEETNKNNTKEGGKISWMKRYSVIGDEMEFLEITNKIKHNLPSRPESPKRSRDHRSLSTSKNPLELDDDLLNFTHQNFDIFKLEEIFGPDNTLLMIAAYIFTSSNYFSIINQFNFENFVMAISSGYKSNPYHCSLHAADITQTTLQIAINSKFQSVLKLTNIDMLSLYISCIIHDYKHPGLTNNYLINAKDEIAVLYNDKSVLESYHVSETFKLINSDKKFDIFEGVSEDNYKIIRKRMIDNVLATDMTVHQNHLTFIVQQSSSVKKGIVLSSIIDELDSIQKLDTQQKFMGALIHASDISNPTKPNPIYQKWAQKVVDEFFLQGDLEAKENKKISFLCDRKTVTLSQSQVGFIEGIVKPYFIPFCETFIGLNSLMENMEINLEYFKKQRTQEEQKKKQKNN